MTANTEVSTTPARTRGRHAALTAALVLASALSGAAPGQQGPEGVWLNEKETVAVRIARCAEGNTLCGHIAWLKKPWREDGSLKRDDGRPFCGLQVVSDMAPDGEDRWAGGTIYDPDEESSFKGRLRLEDADTLRVRAYVMVSLLGRTMVWERIPAPPGSCPAPE